MENKPYIRILPEADTAVLFIHGILGTPRHFTDGIPLLQSVPDNWSVYNVLLDGHGGSVDEFARSSMKKWTAQVWDVFQELGRTHKHIIIAAHSMGTLFAIQLAVEHPELVRSLFLLGVPMRPGMRPSGIWRLIRMIFGYTREDSPLDTATRDVCGVHTTRKLWKYIKWIPRFLELFHHIWITEKCLPQLKVPVYAYQSEKDEQVMNRSARVLQKSGVVEVSTLPNSTHYYYHPEDSRIVLRDFSNLCNEISHD